MNKKIITIISIVIIIVIFNNVTIYAKDTDQANNTVYIDEATKFCDSISKNSEMFLSNIGWEYVIQKVIGDKNADMEDGYNILKELCYDIYGSITDIPVIKAQEVFLRAVILIETRNMSIAATAFIWPTFPFLNSSEVIISKVKRFYDYQTIIDPQKVIDDLRIKLNTPTIPYHMDILAKQVYYKFYMKKYSSDLLYRNRIIVYK